MTVSNRITQFVGAKEKFVSTWYLDPTGTPTIGYGFTWGSKIFREWFLSRYNRKMRRGDTIEKADALKLLSAILNDEALPPVEKVMPFAKSNIKDAAASFVQNAGAGALAWKWAKAIAKGDIKGGAALWRKTATTSKGRSLPGLIIRRAEEADIAELNKWPSWLTDYKWTDAPAPRVEVEEIKQAQLWLDELGYEPGPADGVPGGRTKQATLRFQKEHGALVEDGIIGAATLAALQRAVEVKSKIKKVGTGAVVVSGTGLADNATGGQADGVPIGNTGLAIPDWAGDVLFWGGLAVGLAIIIYLAWRYRDEINALLRRL